MGCCLRYRRLGRRRNSLGSQVYLGSSRRSGLGSRYWRIEHHQRSRDWLEYCNSLEQPKTQTRNRCKSPAERICHGLRRSWYTKQRQIWGKTVPTLKGKNGKLYLGLLGRCATYLVRSQTEDSENKGLSAQQIVTRTRSACRSCICNHFCQCGSMLRGNKDSDDDCDTSSDDTIRSSMQPYPS